MNIKWMLVYTCTTPILSYHTVTRFLLLWLICYQTFSLPYIRWSISLYVLWRSKFSKKAIQKHVPATELKMLCVNVVMSCALHLCVTSDLYIYSLLNFHNICICQSHIAILIIPSYNVKSHYAVGVRNQISKLGLVSNIHDKIDPEDGITGC